jgi:CBS domain-containing protein
LLVKSTIWAVSLGSGTSGGVLAPLLMMGGALGGIGTAFLPNEGAGFWPLVCMGAMLGGTMRSPFTGIIFVLELTHDVNMLVPLLLAVSVAHAFTVLVLRRSILTEKVARRGYHLSREYSVDPLEILFVREVMRTNVVALPVDATRHELSLLLKPGGDHQAQRLFPVIDSQKQLLGALSRDRLQEMVSTAGPSDSPLATLAGQKPVVAYAGEPLRVVVYRMAETGLTRFPVVVNEDDRTLAGMVSLNDLLRARTRTLEEERSRERVLRIRIPWRTPRTTTAAK